VGAWKRGSARSEVDEEADENARRSGRPSQRDAIVALGCCQPVKEADRHASAVRRAASALLGIAPGLFVIIYGRDSSCATLCADWRLYGDADASAVLTHGNTGRLRAAWKGTITLTLL
jgi:sugar (pentulose or hexulose) kinase